MATANPTSSAIPTPQVKLPQLQRQNASLESGKPDPHSARGLLVGAHRKNWEAAPSVHKLQAAHAEALLKSPVGRDFALITASGVEFKIHSIMLIGGPKMLEDGLFPGGALYPDPPTLVNFPPHFHPILVDRVVNFIYMSEYDFDPANKENVELKPENFNFYNATFIPPDASSSPTVTALMGIRNYIFHLHIYALAESLSYPSVQLTAFSRLVSLLIKQRTLHPHDLIALVNATFAPPGTPNRICIDADSVLQTLVVTAVILHEAKDWSFIPEYMHKFTDALRAPEYAEFWNKYYVVKEENADVLKKSKARRAAEERQAVRVARIRNGITAPRSPARKGGEGGISKSERGRKRAEGRGQGNGKKKGGFGVGDVDMMMG
ncbi:hypothetical protein BKA63DRAFT_417094 [Paraphoma chrysanthemicola]|nr:hypothetical protein BKA63DRAFT_417094 [Paraphoma chrysanthemicola]